MVIQPLYSAIPEIRISLRESLFEQEYDTVYIGLGYLPATNWQNYITVADVS